MPVTSNARPMAASGGMPVLSWTIPIRYPPSVFIGVTGPSSALARADHGQNERAPARSQVRAAEPLLETPPSTATTRSPARTRARAAGESVETEATVLLGFPPTWVNRMAKATTSPARRWPSARPRSRRAASTSRPSSTRPCRARRQLGQALLGAGPRSGRQRGASQRRGEIVEGDRRLGEVAGVERALRRGRPVLQARELPLLRARSAAPRRGRSGDACPGSSRTLRAGSS